MSVRKSKIIFLVGFLSSYSPSYISRQGLEYAIQTMIEEKDLSENEQIQLTKMLEENPESLLTEKCRYFGMIKNYILPFIKR